jgi:hypothetical protein
MEGIAFLQTTQLRAQVGISVTGTGSVERACQALAILPLLAYLPLLAFLPLLDLYTGSLSVMVMTGSKPF